ncbi:uncharacterized protein SPAPADRAFT_133310 [Spathaspora passalidarum NRRL Y-27907]|uniref:Zn(2)-C6 fungal-type domain-containing protein n=1 Tax=Spathaspora passalidarum (strain NRRL Y-27907 / 11-Y1) TaxID=619300 RepID=G3AI90_SPAPN|nr:uncharacterized protein SPAPADRAFT_133310 [Spathaspora passalidarum NRRL Y-27907]EGW33660.1 hypothetical protein SPAPADRAFT_133310 [Spathaspora passalidarum NRRL Y-27907]
MNKYLHEFQLQVNTKLSPTKAQTPILNVFKKKNFTKVDPDQSEPEPEFEFDNPTKSKISCIRCRKFKKRCSRDFPECTNCESSDELCKYIPRKVRSPTVLPIDSKTYTMKRNSPEPTGSPRKRHSLPNLSSVSIDKKIMPNDLNAILN